MAWTQIIVLDDQKIDQEIMKIACGIIGIKCTSYDDWQIFMQHFVYFDGCVLDYDMPYFTGVEIAQKIRDIFVNYPILFRSNFEPESPQWKEMIKFGKVINKGSIDETIKSLVAFSEEIKASKFIKQDRRTDRSDEGSGNRRDYEDIQQALIK